MSAPNDFGFTSSNKEKVAFLINRKQGENYHMRPVKMRHTGFSIIVTTAVPRSVAPSICRLLTRAHCCSDDDAEPSVPRFYRPHVIVFTLFSVN